MFPGGERNESNWQKRGKKGKGGVYASKEELRYIGEKKAGWLLRDRGKAGGGRNLPYFSQGLRLDYERKGG